MSEPATTPLLVSAKQVAGLLGVSLSSLWAYHASGRVPMPVKVCGRTMWVREEIESWVRGGCPARCKWNEMRGTGQ